MSTIRFTSPELQDSGYYMCVASNPVDQESWEVVFDVYPLGSQFVDKGFGDVAVNLDAGEDEDDLCEDGTCEDIVFLSLGSEESGQTAEVASSSGGILLAVAGGAGLLITAVVVVIVVLLIWRCRRK